MRQLVSLHCPECAEDVWDVPPTNLLPSADLPRYSHATDRSALCPVMTTEGYRPADPAETTAELSGGRS